jgi:hypothetical protein
MSNSSIMHCTAALIACSSGVASSSGMCDGVKTAGASSFSVNTSASADSCLSGPLDARGLACFDGEGEVEGEDLRKLNVREGLSRTTGGRGHTRTGASSVARSWALICKRNTFVDLSWFDCRIVVAPLPSHNMACGSREAPLRTAAPNADFKYLLKRA